MTDRRRLLQVSCSTEAKLPGFWNTSWVRMSRRIGRRLGVNRFLARIVLHGGYEDRFDSALAGAIAPGDVIWDVGANVGYYSRRFSERVGPRGTVVAFEPGSSAAARLRIETAGLENVRVLEIALGKTDESGILIAGSNPDGTNTQVRPADGGKGEVAIMRGDSMLGTAKVPQPNVIKVDVEGAELEVLSGMPRVLGDSRLRSVAVELHASVAEARGDFDLTVRVESLLRNAGFLVRWVDHAHIMAERP